MNDIFTFKPYLDFMSYEIDNSEVDGRVTFLTKKHPVNLHKRLYLLSHDLKIVFLRESIGARGTGAD